MRILVTGVSSYIGRYLTESFIKRKINIIGISRKNPKIKSKYFLWKKKDLSISNKFEINKKIDFIIHVAGNAHRNENSILDYIQGNIINSYNLAKIAKKLNPKCIFYLSTREIYGEINSKTLTEKNDIINPIVYGQSKYLAEKIFEQNFKTISLRLSSVLGVGTHGWISHIYKSLKENRKIKIINTNFNNFIHVNDVFNIIYSFINNKLFYSDHFNVCCSNIIKSAKVIEIMKKIIKSKSKIILKKTKVKFYTISNKKMLNFFKTMSVENSIIKFTKEMEIHNTE